MDKINLLIVDDSISILSSLSKILELSGYEVDIAHNGSEALRKLQNKTFDLVICDIEMPGITGLDFLKKVRDNYGDSIDVILMTGYLDQDYFIKAIRLGASDFIQKPIDANNIIRAIESTIQRKKEHNNVREFYRHLDKTDLTIIINPAHFSKYSISKVFAQSLQSNFKLPPDLLNEILICIDEMVYNAFIHGTLKLKPSERFLSRQGFQDLLTDKLTDPQIANRRIRFSFVIDAVNGMLEMEVEDDGDGFEHELWLKGLEDNPGREVLEYGRGISLLFHLSDSMKFSKQGRCLRIKKDISGYLTDAIFPS